MINYNIKMPDMSDDVFNLKKATYGSLADHLKKMLEEKMQQFESELSGKNVNVDIDMPNGTMNVTSPDLPSELVQRI